MGRGRESKDYIIHPYEEEIEKLYWNKNLSFSEISRRLNLCSGTTLYRYMKRHNKVRTREEQLENLKKSNTGRAWTDETRRNVSEGVKRSYENNEKLRSMRSESNRKRWRKLSQDEKEEKCRKRILAGHIATQKKHITSIEIKMKKQLQGMGWEFKQQFPMYYGRFIVDFYIPKYRMIIECNGEYWHRLPERIDRDKRLEEFAKEHGFRIIFVWENEINKNVHDALFDALWRYA